MQENYVVDVKIFVERLEYSDATHDYYATGRLVELKDFGGVSLSNSVGLGAKSMQFSYPDPFRKYSKHSVSTGKQRQDAGYEFAQDIQKRFAGLMNSSNTKNVSDPIETIILAPIEEGITTVLSQMQRIWFVTQSKGVGYDIDGADYPVRYSIMSGIISQFSVSESAEGVSEISVSCIGLSRFLELTEMHLNAPTVTKEKTKAEIIAKEMLGMRSGYENALGTLTPSEAMVYPIWVTNAMFTKDGWENVYDNKPAEPDPIYFQQDPIWKLSSDMPQRGDLGDVFKTNMPLFLFGDEINKNLSEKLIGMGTYSLQKLGAMLFFEKDSLTVSDLLPSIYADPLINLLYKTTSVFQEKIRSNLEMYAINKKTALDVLNELATTIYGSCREDDFGNIRLEIPPTWIAPDRYNTIDKYKDIYEGQNMEDVEDGLLLELSHNYDYVLHDWNTKGSTMSFNESNIVTLVEATMVPKKVEMGDEKLIIRGFRGQTAVNGEPDEERELKLQQLQNRYGIRNLTAPQLYSSMSSRKILLSGEQVSITEMLTEYAWALLDFRNFSAKATTYQTTYLHWLDLNKNIYDTMKQELWLLESKSLSWNPEGEVSCTFTAGLGHSPLVPLGYPFLDVMLKDPAWKNASAADPALVAIKFKQKKQEKTEKIKSVQIKQNVYRPTIQSNGLSSAYNGWINHWAKYNNVSAGLIWSLMWKESNFKVSAVSPDKAKGLMQIMDATWKQVTGSLANYQKWVGDIKEMEDDVFNPCANIYIGVYYFKTLMRQFNHNTKLAIMAYNSGPGKIAKQIDAIAGTKVYANINNPIKSKIEVAKAQGKLYNGKTIEACVIKGAYKETRDYVDLISKKYNDRFGGIIEHAKKYSEGDFS